MSDDEILRGFESGTFPHANWNHAAHLRVAGCYLLAHPREEALRRMSDGVRKYNESVGTANTEDSGYHETLARFWIAVAGAFLAGLPNGISRTEKIQALVDQFAPRRDLFREYYSFDVVKSREARRDWVAPDLKAL